MEVNNVQIEDTYITLAQLLKLMAVVGSGGEVKPFLESITVFYNGEIENRKGKKLYHGDAITIPELQVEYIIESLVYHE